MNPVKLNREGGVNSKEDFRKLLEETIPIVRKLDPHVPDYTVLLSIGNQLEAIKEWAAKGAPITKEQKESIIFGVQTVRELENSGDPETDDLCKRLYALSYYFKHNF